MARIANPGSYAMYLNGSGTSHEMHAPQDYGDQTAITMRVPVITKAVIVCIHYFNTVGQLGGQNPHGMARFLQQIYGCPCENIIILSDIYYRPTSQPTKRAILQSMHWLVSECVPGDRLFFFSSGHGQPSRPIVPVDFKENGCITEADIETIVVRNLQPGILATIITDYYGTPCSVREWFGHLAREIDSGNPGSFG